VAGIQDLVAQTEELDELSFNQVRPRVYSLGICMSTLRLMTLMAVLGACSDTALAQTPEKTPPATRTAEIPAGQAGRVSDPADLEAFFDGAISVQMESQHIAGAVVALVVGDKVVFTKGYGYADLEGRRKVDPQKTLFRIASISKLFTWTAVMQQVEEGKLDLDADINQYVKDVKIPATYDRPITLKHLLTHTPGFDDYVIGLFAHNPEEVRPLGELLKEQMPSRVRPAGEIASYSNHGTALAGYAVACVSGMPWEDYVEQRILQPLGMKHTLVRQPAKAKLPADLSIGYEWKDGRFKANEFEYIPMAPAGCVSTTAADIAQFMLAHLHDGQLGGARILKAETARRMRDPLFRHDAKTTAMCYGFWEQERNGVRIVGHGGDTLWFHSLLQLIPERGVGFFVSYNTDKSQEGSRDALFDAFLRRYFPAPDPPRIAAKGDFRERAQRIAGEYVITRYSHTSLTKLMALVSALKVSVNDDDTLSIGSGLGESSRRYVEVEPFVFREVDGLGKIVFQEDENGRVRYLFPADWAAVSAERRKWYELEVVQFGLLIGSVAIFASALLFWPSLAFSLRGLKSPNINRSRFSGLLSCLAWLLCVVCLGFLIGLGVVLKDPEEIAFGMTAPLYALLAATQFCAGLSAITVLACLLAWKNRYWRFTGRLHYTLVALAGVGFTWFLYHWNLLTVGFAGIF
jgi:CubicO group peptidase (beta-lactamase class C family)